ncbi:glycosyltransferase [Infirmifilum lucidum]|uniref:Glycosyltransferase n=1 Tax=Infirmifilum lucidum TaxID=2776706 RepID=A0A7L9FK13_9CREN|nr:glycosyltransferase [Infirmifilum lucidum]QOJ79274.1 glycosyltransferase [Infirmifilum lucidum]
MRIVHIAPFYRPVVGGVEEVAEKIAEYMASRGHEVYVLTYNRDRRRAGGLPEREEINGVEVVRLRPDFAYSHGTYSAELPKALEAQRGNPQNITWIP